MAIGLLISVFGFFGCQKSNDAPAVAATTYVLQNGLCVASTGQTVDRSLCGSNNGYILQNGGCYSVQTAQYVSPNLCTQNSNYTSINGSCYTVNTNQIVDPSYCNTNGVGGVGSSVQCNGSYSYNGQVYQCYTNYNGNNCRGYTMIELNTGRSVLCQ